MRRSVLAAAACVVACGTSLLPAAAAPSQTQRRAAPRRRAALAGVGDAPSTAPAYPGDFPDPDVIRVGPEYWAYATGSAGRNLQAMSSIDLHTWGPIADPIPVLPDWAEPGHTWAPGVVEIGPRFLMYYTVRDGASGRQCLSVATALAPGGPFSDPSSAPLICQLDHGGSIDPSPFTAPDGTRYLLWKSDDNALGRPTHLWSARLGADGLSLARPPALLLDETAAWQYPSMEGPAMMTLAGRFYLFYGANRWDTPDAGIGYAICRTPVGGCTDRSPTGPWVGSHGAAAGPAGPAPFTDISGAPEMGYHAWGAAVGYENGGARSLWVDRLRFGQGYRSTAADGGVFGFGAAGYLGSASTARPSAPIVGLSPTEDGDGYWQVGADGGVYSFGAARFLGSTGAIRLARRIVGMIPSPGSGGYALVGADGGLFSFGDFPFLGSAAAARPASPIVGGATSGLLPGPGYWLAGADGRVFSFGAAPALGSLAGTHLKAPIVAIAPSPTGEGYWLVAADGGVFTFGAAGYHGSLGGLRLVAPIVGITPTPTGAGYWLVAADGGVFAFGDAGYLGSLGATRLVAPVVGLAVAPGPLLGLGP